MLNIQENILLAPYTTFKIGGPAKYFIEAKNEENFKEALKYALKNELKFFVLGGGSNILISDKGFDGLVIKFQNTECKLENTKITCGSGTSLAKLVTLAKDNSLTGLEWAIGIPGTVGGAVRGNAGAFEGEIKDLIQEVKVFIIEKDIECKNFTREECEFGYRESIFKRNKKLLISSVDINLEKGNKTEIQDKMNDILVKRNKNLPEYMQNAGSFFVNPIVNDDELIKRFERDSGKKVVDNIIPAGWLIQCAGLAGKKIGGAAISEKHSNFIVNIGNARAEDVIILSSLIKQKVRTKFKVQLREEVEFVGF